MTLPQFSAEHERLQHMSIDRSCTVCPQGAQQQTSHTPLLLSINETDGHPTVT